MTSYVVLTYKGMNSTRSVEYHRDLSVLKREYTRKLNAGDYDKVVLVDGNAINHFEWTRRTGDAKWSLKTIPRKPGEWDPS